ncbi:MAG: LLM class flavin-dependent oxidoreductase, partial [Acidimicrobiia bacterium]|nr:LLM class flavin-dependent oxidoreductase [Acidimicrobiia bacterium]
VGFDSLGVLDHLRWDLEAGPHGFWECLSVVAALAAVTSKIRLTTAVLNSQFRNPALVAKMAETIDMLSEGRFTLGLGAGGGPPVEYESFGFTHDRRYSHFEEAIEIIHGLLRNGEIDFRGSYYQAPGCILRPRGPRPSGPPIAIGAGGPKMMRLTARFADEWNGFTLQNPTTDFFAPMLAELAEACRDVGRDPQTLRRSIDIVVAPTGETEPLPQGFGVPIHGPPGEIADQLAAFSGIGISEGRTYLWPQSIDTIEAMAPVLAELATTSARATGSSGT